MENYNSNPNNNELNVWYDNSNNYYYDYNFFNNQQENYNTQYDFNQQVSTSNENQQNMIPSYCQTFVENSDKNYINVTPNSNYQNSIIQENFPTQSDCYKLKENNKKHNTLLEDFSENVDEKEKKRQLNNTRERIRVHKMNEEFNELEKVCNYVTNQEVKMTKLGVLENAFTLIDELEHQVKEKLNKN